LFICIISLTFTRSISLFLMPVSLSRFDIPRTLVRRIYRYCPFQDVQQAQ
jgi:hypothetical protein